MLRMSGSYPIASLRVRMSAAASPRALLVAALVAMAWLALPDSSYGQSRRTTRRPAPSQVMPPPPQNPSESIASPPTTVDSHEYLLPAVQSAAPTPAAASSRRQRTSPQPVPAPHAPTEFQALAAATPCPHLTIPSHVPLDRPAEPELQLAAPLPQIVTADVAIESLAADAVSPCPPNPNDVAAAGEIELFRDPQEFQIDMQMPDFGPPILSGDSLAAAIDAGFGDETKGFDTAAVAGPPSWSDASAPESADAGPPILSSTALAETIEVDGHKSKPDDAESIAAEPQVNSEMPLFVELSRFRVQRPIPTEPVDMTLADGATQRTAEFTWPQDPVQDQEGLSIRQVPDSATQQVQESDREQELLTRMREPLPASPLSRVGIPVGAENKLVEPERFTDRHYGDYAESATIEVGPRQLSYVQWQPRAFAWAAPNFYHRPLYYEAPNLERYGFDHGCAQPVYSAGHFFVSTVLLPLQIGGDHPCSRAYALGYYRPGSCNPAYLSHYPVTPRGLIYQSLSTMGAVFILP